ncbi:MAG: hypothetical protein J5637_07845 [Prevotella sp.]|nr:hypothetical protein [Prevotella sp.]
MEKTIIYTLSGTTSDDLKAAVKELTSDAKSVTKYNETLGFNDFLLFFQEQLLNFDEKRKNVGYIFEGFFMTLVMF